MRENTRSFRSRSDISEAADFILKGGIVGVPTETVYGLAANALNESAVRKIFEAKMRPFIDPLIVHVCDMKMANDIAYFFPNAERLAKKFWPGPLTLILKKKPAVPDIATAGLETVAVRMPSHPDMRALIRESGVPIAAPSANPFGYVSPTTAAHVAEQLGNRIDFIIDGGACDRGVESTIVALSTDNSPAGKILRFGPIGAEEIEKELGFELDKAPKTNEAQPEAPGMLKSHYSPKIPLELFDESPSPEKNAATIFFKRPKTVSKDCYWLSEDGSTSEAAKNLYSVLRALDKLPYSKILCQRCPVSEGEGAAINDRLSRASAKRR